MLVGDLFKALHVDFELGRQEQFAHQYVDSPAVFPLSLSSCLGTVTWVFVTPDLNTESCR